MDLGFGPDEWLVVGIVGFNEVIDVLPELFDRGEGRVVEGLPLQDREPDFDLVEPGSPRRREMETHVGMTLEPAVVFGLVGVEVVEDDMDGGVRMSGDDVVHEIEEFDASPTILMGGGHLAGGHLEGGEQRRGAVTLVVVTLTGQSRAVRKLQLSLGALQRLDRGLLIDADDDRVLGRRHVQTDHVGGLGGELRIVALAPGFAPGEVDLLGAQEAPDILDIDIAEPRGQQRSGPAGIALGRRLVQKRQDPFTRLRRVLRLGAPLPRLVETREPPLRRLPSLIRARSTLVKSRNHAALPHEPWRLQSRS
jgi:hypothetical protein